MTRTEALAVHQLVGRLVYFHVLFIEPSLGRVASADATTAVEGRRQGDRCGRLSHGLDLDSTAWKAVVDIADELTPRGEGRAGCPACVVRRAGTTIAGHWIDVEGTAYAMPPVRPEERRAWSEAVGSRLAGTFAAQHDVVCDVCARRPVPGTEVDPPSSGRLPLTAELLALWDEPTGPAPVVSWLNHCATLDDVTRIVAGDR